MHLNNSKDHKNTSNAFVNQSHGKEGPEVLSKLKSLAECFEKFFHFLGGMWQLLNSTWQPQRQSGAGWETGIQYFCGNCGGNSERQTAVQQTPGSVCAEECTTGGVGSGRK